MKLTIISKEIIKPSSLSTQNLKPHKLCLLDQIASLTYATCVLFYPNNTPVNESNFTSIVSKTLTHLKKSLSDTLNVYYPFSGRLKDDMVYVDDFEAGVPFLEAFVNCPMSVYFHKFDSSELLNKLLPYPAYRKETNRPIPIPLLAFQANVFSCGGIAIGTSLCHTIGDGASMFYIFSSWAALSRGSPNEVIKPNFSDTAILFPPLHDFVDKYSLLLNQRSFETGSYMTRRFLFSAKAVETLREKARMSEDLPKPTRNDAIMCFIWKHVIEASWAISGSRKAIPIAHQSVNMRSKLKFQNPIGNLLWLTTTFANTEESSSGSIELPKLVNKLRESMKEYESVMQSLEDQEYKEGCGTKLILRKMEESLSVLGKLETKTVLRLTNVRGFFNEVDFGLGKPYKVRLTGEVGSASANGVCLVDCPSGVGVEAFITLEEKLMVVLERDVKFLAFASTDSRISSL